MRRAATAIRTLALAGLLGLIPVACSEHADNGKDAVRPITAGDMPRLKPGIWRTSTRTGDSSPDTLVQCIGQDHSLALSMGEAQARCPTLSMMRAGRIYLVTARCRHEGGETLVRARFTGDFRSTMRAEIEITRPGPDHQPRQLKLVSVGRYEGPCPDGQAPGLVDDGD